MVRIEPYYKIDRNTSDSLDYRMAPVSIMNLVLAYQFIALDGNFSGIILAMEISIQSDTH